MPLAIFFPQISDIDFATQSKLFGLSIALLSDIRLVDLPVNTTSLLQTIDQDIIAVFKQLYNHDWP